MYRLSLLCVCFFLFSSSTLFLEIPIFQEVVTTTAQPVDHLRVVTEQYLQALDEEKPKKQRGEWQANADSTTFTFDSDLLLYNRKTVKSPLGELTYRTTIELKEGKYRYTADSAFFQPYHRNRYSRYVPSRAPAIPWEKMQMDLPAKVTQRALATVQDRFAAFQRFVLSQQQTSLPVSQSEDDW